MQKSDGAQMGKDSAFAMNVAIKVLETLKLGMFSKGSVRDRSETLNGVAIVCGRTTRGFKVNVQVDVQWSDESRRGILPLCKADVIVCYIPMAADGISELPEVWKRFNATHDLDSVQLVETKIALTLDRGVMVPMPWDPDVKNVLKIRAPHAA